MGEPVKVLVEIDGGRVCGVYTAGVPVAFVVVDYNRAGGDPRELRKVDGVEAYVQHGEAFPDGSAVLKAFEAAEGVRPAPSVETDHLPETQFAERFGGDE